MKLRPELLVPAGNFEKMNFAFKYGADAVYLGGKFFNLRERADNFSFSELKKAKKIADKYSKNIYFTLNASFRNKDFKKLGIYCEKLLDIGVNKIIISDLGVLNFINNKFNKLFHVSMSTQANITNYYIIDLLMKYNINRIILARELNLKEIAEIKEKIKVELEVFIHGAMCVSYSGRCLLSEYLTNRNANRGDCTQSCRWDYYLIEESRKDQLFPIIENKNSTTILSSKDLCTLPILKRLIKTDIDSFKIEGRMKSLYYVANITRIYREAIDSIFSGKRMDMNLLKRELDLVSHRPYFTGFFEKNKSTITYDLHYIRKVEFVGYLKKRIKDNLYEVVLKNKLEKGDKIEIILPGMKNLNIDKFQVFNKDFIKTDRGIINRKFYIELDKAVEEWGIIRRVLE